MPPARSAYWIMSKPTKEQARRLGRLAENLVLFARLTVNLLASFGVAYLMLYGAWIYLTIRN